MIGNPERTVPWESSSRSILSASALAMASAALSGMTPARASARASAISTSINARTRAGSVRSSAIASSLKMPAKMVDSKTEAMFNDGCAESYRSHIEENRFVFPLQPNVETVNRLVIFHSGRGDQSLATLLALDRTQHRITRVGGFVGEIQTGVRVHEHAPGENNDIQMGRLHLVAQPGHRSRFDGLEAVKAILIGPRSAPAAECHIERLLLLI